MHLSHPNNPRSTSRGLAMPLAMMILFVMVVLIGALMGIIGQELREVAYTGFDNRALYLADAGIQEMVSLEEASSPALAVSPPVYKFPADPNGLQPSFLVTIKNHNYINNRRTYLMQSMGTSSEGYVRYVNALSLEDTFANYNYAGWSNAAGNYFVAGLMQYNGPVYLGGTNSAPVNVWWQNGQPSLFLDKVTVQGSLAWSTAGGGNNAPVSQSDWQSVDSHGSSYLSQVTNPIKFPPDAAGSVIATEALTGLPGNGTTMPSVSKPDVYVNDNPAKASNSGGLVTGIYVNGSTQIGFASSAVGSNPDTETITFKPGTSGTPIQAQVTVTVNYTANTTTVVEGGFTSTYTGVPSGPGSSDVSASSNGAIFVNGDINALAGTQHGQQTIATNDNNQNTSENNITITDNLSYKNDPQTCGCTSTDELGIIGHNVLVASTAPANLTIEAAVFAGNSYDYNHPNNKVGTFATDQYGNPQNISKKGPLLVYGSLVNNYISPLGVFDMGTGQLVKGWADSYTWDTRFKTTAPPFYPSLSSYTIVGWTDCGQNPCP
jgi:hypothetical protein